MVTVFTHQASRSKVRRETEGVGRFVAIALVASQALRHAERVVSPFQELGELLVVVGQSCPLGSVRSCLPCGCLDLVGCQSQYRGWSQIGYLGIGNEPWMLTMPVSRLLIGMADTEHRRVVEGTTEYLHPQR